jgi:hypothetical protein
MAWWILFGIGAVVLAAVAGYAGLKESNAELAGWLGVAAAVFGVVDNALRSQAKALEHRARGAGLLGVEDRAKNLATKERITQGELDKLAAERSRLHEPGKSS